MDLNLHELIKLSERVTMKPAPDYLLEFVNCGWKSRFK